MKAFTKSLRTHSCRTLYSKTPTAPLTTRTIFHNLFSAQPQHEETHHKQKKLNESLLEHNQLANGSSRSLKDLLSEVSTVIPEITRKFWRVPVLEPNHVLELLLCFQSECSKAGIISVEKVMPLWLIFKTNLIGLNHVLPQSYEVMASLLMQVDMLGEAEHVLSSALELEAHGNSISSLHCSIEILLSNLIESYVAVKDLEKAILVYSIVRNRGMVPSRSCYGVLVDLLVRTKRAELAFRVSVEMLDRVGAPPLSGAEVKTLENLIVLLCAVGKIQEARSMMKKVLPYNFEVSDLVFNEIAFGYCEKKDFKDLISFFVEVNHTPSVVAANRAINSLCRSYGVEIAGMFMHELEENVGFKPDEVTYGIVIGWSCHEGKLKDALSYLSTMISRGLLPCVYTYNALMSGLFKVGMLEHARYILDEVIDRGMQPDISTFRVLIAGYCKSRRFDKVKTLIHEMEGHGFVKLSSVENPLSKAFMILGLNPLSVRLKRDNDRKLSKTEFFDDIGNGLYLDTDVDEYENHITRVLEESMVPNFNSSVMKECINNNPKGALILVEEMLWWGQELLLPNFSKLVRILCSSRSQIKSMIKLLEQMPRSANKFDPETLNLVLQAYSRKGLLCKAKTLLDEMLQNKYQIENETFTAILLPLLKKGNLKDLSCYWQIACRNKWLPGLKEFKHLLVSICHRKMLREASQLLEIMLQSYPNIRLDICHVFLEVLSATSLTNVALVELEQLQHYCKLDHAGYNNLIRCICNEGKFSLAFTMLDDMLDKNLVPCLDVLLLLIPKLCKADRYDQAVALKERILKEQPSFSHAAHCALIHGFYNMGNIGKANTLSHDLLSKDLILDDELCNILVQGHCRASDLRKVEELLGIAIKRSWELSLSSYRHLVRLMCMKGRVLFALSLKDLMIAQCPPDGTIVYNILIFYLLSTGNSLVVNKILIEMEEKKVVLDEVGHDFLVYGFWQCKDLSSSLHYLATMISKGLKPSKHNLRKVISSLCDAGELQKALELSQEMRLRGWIHDSVTQTAITECLLSCGKIQEAEAFLDMMEGESLSPDNINYDYLIKRLCKCGRFTKAVHLINIMLKKSNIPISTSYDSIIHGFCSINKLDEALDFYSEMLNWNLRPRVDTAEMLVHSFCQDQRTKQAEQFLSDMICISETPTRKMYSTVIKSYHKEKNLRKASELMQAMQENGYQPDFETHWSLISNLSGSKAKDTDNDSKGFLSRLLSNSGFR